MANRFFSRYSVIVFISHILALILLILGSVLMYNNQKRYVINDEITHLQTISDFKVTNINEWIEERLADANTLASNLRMIDNIDNYVKYRKQEESYFIKTRFEAYIAFKKYAAVFLIDLEGNILVETPASIEVIDTQIKEIALSSLDGKAALMGEMVYCEHHDDIHWDVYVPVYRDYPTRQIPIAIMIFRMDSSTFIKNNVTSYPIPTETAEGLIIEVKGDSILVLTPTRHDPDAALKLLEPLTANKTALHSALEGKARVDVSIDYRGKEVFAIVQPIAHQDWYLVTKIDKEEALRPLKGYLFRLIIMNLFILMLIYLAISITRKTLKHRRLEEMYLEQKDRQALLQHFMYIVKHANDIIYLCDADDRIVQYNDSALRFYGYSVEEFEQLQAARLIDSQTYKKHKEIYSHEDYLQGLVLETLHVLKDGTIKPVEASIRAIEIDGEHYYQCIIRDISERKAAEAMQEKLHNEIRELNTNLEFKVLERTAQLQKAYDEVESFSYSVSHDLRAPLRSIRGFGEALQEDFGALLPEEANGHIERILNACKNMNDLIDSLMELSKISAKDITPRQLDVSSLIEELYSEMMESNPDRVFSLVLSPGINVCGDALLLRTALKNIVGNALKFSSNHRQTEITIDFEEDEEQIRVSITDNGIGFDMKYVDKLFEPFQRLHSAEKYSGFGIGLSIVKRVMQKHGGDARIFGEKDVGTTVYLDFVKHTNDIDDIEPGVEI